MDGAYNAVVGCSGGVYCIFGEQKSKAFRVLIFFGALYLLRQDQT